MSYNDNAAKFEQFYPLALRVHAATGVFPSVVLAHWALETSYFTSGSFTDANNIGGIKYVGQAQASGSMYGHAKYDSVDQGVADYIRVLSLGYLSAMRSAGTPESQIAALHASPYAEDGSQDTKLLNILNTYGLIGYDTYTGGGTQLNPVAGIISNAKDTLAGMDQEQMAKMAGVGLLVVALLALVGE
jgi:flagellum-specific peptidoglycan hydrolase FlgJ